MLTMNTGVGSQNSGGSSSTLYSIPGGTPTEKSWSYQFLETPIHNEFQREGTMTVSVHDDSSATWTEPSCKSTNDFRSERQIKTKTGILQHHHEFNAENECVYQKYTQDSFAQFHDRQNAPTHQKTGPTEIPEKFNVLDWVGQGKPKRYIIVKLIQPKGGKIEERLTIQHASDQVVWNVLYIFDSKSPFPTESPTPSDRALALQYITQFRTQFVKVFCNEARNNYFMATFQDEWKGICKDGKPFKSFADLEYRTRNETSELVSIFQR